MTLSADGSYTLTKVKYTTPDGVEESEDISGKLDKKVRTPMGELLFERTPYYKAEDMVIYISRTSIYNALTACQDFLPIGSQTPGHRCQTHD